jgi:D-alanyl-D-alanine carboxypeptidase/D-alanyl-D-alanine-endopeptidase (penicillin-binding protein 4)
MGQPAQRPLLRRLLLCLIALCLITACATTAPPPPKSLAARIEPIIAAAASLRGAIWGIRVEDQAGGILYEQNAHTLLMPASNRKLFTAAASADCLGLTRQFTTELWLDGDDVILRGGGDPSLGGRWTFDRDALWQPFVDALRARGIAEVRGDLVADASRFDRVTIPGSWKFGNLGADYAAPVDALGYNENVVGVVVDDCAHPLLTTDPLFLNATADVVCGPGEPAVRVDETNTVHVTGSMSKHFDGLFAVGDPALYAAQAFASALKHAGIAVHGRIRVNTTPRAWGERLAAIDSPPLWQLLSVVLKPSQNLYAETIYKDLSAAGSYAASADVERRFLAREGGIDAREGGINTREGSINTAEFRFVDGSGLAPDDLVTPAAVVRVLRWMYEPSRREQWAMMLAVPGQEGTLRRRLKDLAPSLHAKTGTIAGVNALSGVIAVPGGGFRYFSIIVNHHIADGNDAIKAIDAIVLEIAR